MTTGQLLEKCIKRNSGAWNRFVRSYEPLVARSIRYKLNKLNLYSSKNEILDISQEVFRLIWEKNKLREVKNTACLESWLAIISLNTTSNYFRGKAFKAGRNTVSLDKYLNSEMPRIPLNSILPSSQFDTAEIIDSNELKIILKNEISKLAPKQQIALKLKIYNGKRQKDIAKIMNIPGGTVSILIRRAKQRLRRRLRHILDVPRNGMTGIK